MRSPSVGDGDAATGARFELLEGRRLLTGSVVRPDHIVIVVEQDRASEAIGSAVMPYLNQLAASGLRYSDSHGVTHPSQPNLLALYSGSTQGVTTNNQGYSFPTEANLARSLFGAGFSFAGYSENLPADGSQANWAGDDNYPDLYVRYLNPMAQFEDVGIDPGTGQPRLNEVVNRTFGAFSALPAGDYSSLPTVSFIIPNALHSTHGSNEAYPWAGSPDEENNDLLRGWADAWLHDNLDAYYQWAKTHNSLLIITQDEQRYTGGSAPTITTVINGDPDLFVPGVNSDPVTHFNLLRTIQDMYGLAPLNDTAAAVPLDVDALGRLTADHAITGLSFLHDAQPQQVKVTFADDVAVASLEAGDLVVSPLAGGAAIVPASVVYNAATRTASFRLAGVLADGNYRATIAAAGVTDGSGNALATSYAFDFFALSADANRDRRVDFNDLVLLAQNYNGAGKTWAQGDFTGDGVVDFNDLVKLAQRYNTGVPAPAVALLSDAIAVIPTQAAPPSALVSPAILVGAPAGVSRAAQPVGRPPKTKPPAAFSVVRVSPPRLAKEKPPRRNEVLFQR